MMELYSVYESNRGGYQNKDMPDKVLKYVDTKEKAKELIRDLCAKWDYNHAILGYARVTPNDPLKAAKYLNKEGNYRPCS